MTRNILLTTAILLGLQTAAFGQSVVLSVGSASGTAGGTVTVPITLASSGGAQTAGLQWTFNFSSDITGVTVVAGASTTNAGKSLSCSGNNCLVAGFNSTTIADGTVASATFQIAANPSSNPISIQLTTIVATTAGGTSITSSGGGGSISLPGATTALSSLTCTSSTINTPGSTSCSVTLSGAASASGFAVSLSSNNASLTVPASVTVASGQTSNSFTATGALVGSNQSGTVTASAGSVTKTSTLSLVAPAALSSVACAPSTLGSNASSTCTVTLNQAAASTLAVSLASNNGLLTVPSSVNVTSGQSSATFTAASGTIGSNQSAIVTATLSGQSKQATISLAAAAQINSLSCSPATVNAPGTSTCTAALTSAAASATSVTLSSNNTNVTVPGSVNIGSGLSSATFTATVAAVNSNQTALLTASLNGNSQTFTINASAPAALSSVACAPSTLGSNASSTCTVTLNQAAASAATVSLASNNGLLTVPPSVTVTAGQSSATFTATSGVVASSQSATVTATLNGQSKQASMSLAAAAQISSLTCAPSTVNAPGTAACTVTLTAATSGAASVTLLSNNTNITVPGSVNIGSGASSATFTATVAAVTSNQSALLTATLNGVSQSFSLSAATSASATLTSIVCAPATLGSNASSTCTVTLNQAAASAATVSIASNNGLLTVPASVVVAAGQSSNTFAATSGTIGSSQSAIVTATLSGQSRQATISLGAAAQISSLTCTPATVNGPGPVSCTVTLTAAASGAVSVSLASNNSIVTVPGSVNIGSGLSSAAFNANPGPVPSAQTALLTASLNGGSRTFTLSLQAPPKGPKSILCAPSALAGNKAGKCSVTLQAAAAADSVVSISSSSTALSVPPSVTVPAGQSSATFDAISGSVSNSQSAIVTAGLDGQTLQTTIALAPPVDCQEFQTSPGGLCMIQDVLPWVTFGGGWESRLNAGNSGSGAGTIQFNFTLLPAIPSTGGVQNHMPAFFTDSISGQTQEAETGSYILSAGGSVAIDFQAPPAGCDVNGQNCGSYPDPTTSSYGSLQVQYVAGDPASLRGIAKAQLTLLANVTNPDFGWQTTESEMPPSNQWTAPVSVSANPAANQQATQQASAALANPGTSAITVRGTLYDKNGVSVMFRDFQVPAQGAVALLFSQDPSQPFGGFGQAMFPGGQDFNGLVTFQVTSPSGGLVSAMVLQYVGNAVSSVDMSQQGTPASSSSTTRCAEFTMAADGSCTVQYTLPWVVFGGGWESRLKAGNPPSPSSGAVQLRFTLLPSVSTTNGLANHLPAYFTDNRTGQTQVGETANYTLGAGQSVDIHFLYPPAGCDSNGQNCSSQPIRARCRSARCWCSILPSIPRRCAGRQIRSWRS